MVRTINTFFTSWEFNSQQFQQILILFIYSFIYGYTFWDLFIFSKISCVVGTVLFDFAKTTTPFRKFSAWISAQKVNNNAKITFFYGFGIVATTRRRCRAAHVVVQYTKLRTAIENYQKLTKNALSRQAGRPTVHPRLWNRAGRQSGQTQVSPFLPQQKTPDSLVTPLVGILHLTLCSVTTHVCRPRLWTPNQKSGVKLSRVEWSQVESSRVESSWVE